MKYSCKKKTLLDTWQKKEKGVKQRNTERGKLLIQTFSKAARLHLISILEGEIVDKIEWIMMKNHINVIKSQNLKDRCR